MNVNVALVVEFNFAFSPAFGNRFAEELTTRFRVASRFWVSSPFESIRILLFAHLLCSPFFLLNFESNWNGLA